MASTKSLGVAYEFLVYCICKIPYVIRCVWHQATCKNMLRNVRYGPRPRNRLDVYLPDDSQKVGALGNGIILVVHGGAWYWGTKTYFSRIQRSSFPDCTVVVVNYTLHPHGACDVMVEDIALAINWTIDNLCTLDSQHVPRNGITDSNIPPLVLLAHSAGAQLVALALIRSRVDLRRIAAFIGVSGVYHISDHRRYELSRGVAGVSPMCGTTRNILTTAGRAPPVMGADPAGWDSFSPAALILAPAAAEVVGRLPAVLLLHGSADKTVPVSSSESLHQALVKAGHTRSTLTIIQGGGHAGVFTDLNDRGAPCQARVAAEIRAALQRAADE